MAIIQNMQNEKFNWEVKEFLDYLTWLLRYQQNCQNFCPTLYRDRNTGMLLLSQRLSGDKQVGFKVQRKTALEKDTKEGKDKKAKIDSKFVGQYPKNGPINVKLHKYKLFAKFPTIRRIFINKYFFLTAKNHSQERNSPLLNRLEDKKKKRPKKIDANVFFYCM